LDGNTIEVNERFEAAGGSKEKESAASSDLGPLSEGGAPADGGTMVRAPLGRVFGARSGDKGGDANLGVWAREPAAFEFLRRFLTTEKLRELLPSTKSLVISRCELPNLLAVHFLIKGLLGDGAAASMRIDPQAKALGEALRSRVIEMPAALLPQPAS
jgi:hypothetical protein